ncbi:uncharacterized protein LOC130170277 isoform X1 [Seriola aureovittata]|uniref:uncharacterized protein LOC130170277 isoform X1 n=1 Tax=Seriola aureovittata TaxID=2871759 RepID=UPI0024BEE57D|nr:uncharacterized protein LOC130170277 isoform X1 [Seriola aureovittata]XP_056233470.1 uncharacterized protein LOC130170277 isoform X1 [Seriola aureovittata]
MNLLISLLLLLVSGVQYFAVTAGHGGNTSVYFCEVPGCASNVTKIFCKDELVVTDKHIPDCAGHLPPPKSVCQHDGRAFVSSDTDDPCEFEGEAYIETRKCTATSDICSLTRDTKSPEQKSLESIWIVLIVLVSLVSLVCLIIHIYKKRQNREQNPQEGSDSGVAEPLRDIQSSGNTSERDTSGAPGLDDSSSLSQRDHGA